MDYFSADARSLNSTLERALDDASAGLKKAARDLGAEAVAVLFAAGSQVDITYFWERASRPDAKTTVVERGPRVRSTEDDKWISEGGKPTVSDSP